MLIASSYSLSILSEIPIISLSPNKILENSITRKDYFLKKLKTENLFVNNGPLHLVSFSPSFMTEEQSEIWSRRTRQILLENKFMLSSPLYKSRFYLKAVFGNPHTQFHHIDHLVDLLNKSFLADFNNE